MIEGLIELLEERVAVALPALGLMASVSALAGYLLRTQMARHHSLDMAEEMNSAA